jgi:hypothetical protein
MTETKFNLLGRCQNNLHAGYGSDVSCPGTERRKFFCRKFRLGQKPFAHVTVWVPDRLGSFFHKAENEIIAQCFLEIFESSFSDPSVNTKT